MRLPHGFSRSFYLQTIFYHFGSDCQMFRNICLVALILTTSIGGGAWSVDVVLRNFDGFGRLRIGQWEAFPKSGTQDADIYARARAIKLETLALGRSEGIVFTLWHDERGQKLQAGCHYQLEGMMPEAGFFTLYAVDSDRRPKKAGEGRPSILTSDNALRRTKGDYHIAIASQPQGGNWLSIDKVNPEEEDAYGLVLTLYDTPIITATGMSDLDMPRLTHFDGEDCG